MNMNIGYDGTQQEMHPTTINQEVGCLGPHGRIIEVWYEQHMVFQEGDDAPFCITPQDCTVKNFIQCDDTQLKDKTKAQLLGNIKSAGVDISVVKGKMVG